MNKFTVVLASLLVAQLTHAADSKEVVVYSARNEQLIKPLFDAYTKQTGVKVRFVTDKEGPLLAKLKSEGKNTPADLFLTVDAGSLWQASHEGLLASLNSASLKADVPEHLRDPQGQWFGLSQRARTVFFNPKLVKAEQLSTYEDLADAKWKGKLCLRSSKKVYNQSLVAMMIAKSGVEASEAVVKGWVANLAAPAFSDDTKLLEAIDAGQCAVGIANTYYFGRLAKKNPKISVRPFWPNQSSDGVHVNITGAGVTQYAKHPAEAQQLLEWMASTKAQNLFADENMEYPVNKAVKPTAAVAAWGEFKANYINVAKAGELQATAVKLMDRAGYK